MSHVSHVCGPNCVHWSAPLGMPDIQTIDGVRVRLSYEQWLLYHWHVIVHQGGLRAEPRFILTVE